MPTILVIGPYAFRFFALDRTEPRHIHAVHRDRRIGKFCLDPDVRLANNRGYTAKKIRDREQIVEAHADEFRNAWDTFFQP